MYRRLARAVSDGLLRRRASLPASIVWAEATPYGQSRVYLDHLEVEPRALVLSRGELEVARRCLEQAIAPPDGILGRLLAFHADGLPSTQSTRIERDARDAGLLDEAISADKDRRLVSLPPIFNRLLYYLAVETSPGLCLELGTAHGVSALHLLAGLGQDGELVTVEVDPVRRRLALEAIGVLLPDARVTSVEGRFPECLPDVLAALPGPIGLVFEDGPHVADVTVAVFELVREHVRAGGLYIVDDIYSGDNEHAWTAIRSDSRVSAWAELNGRLGICALG